jgi:hypothetical protein
MLGIASGLVVDPAADQTHPGFGFAHVGLLCVITMKCDCSQPVLAVKKAIVGAFALI